MISKYENEGQILWDLVGKELARRIIQKEWIDPGSFLDGVIVIMADEQPNLFLEWIGFGLGEIASVGEIERIVRESLQGPTSD